VLERGTGFALDTIGVIAEVELCVFGSRKIGGAW
jgi:hypothetical protein